MAINLDERKCESCQQSFNINDIELVTVEVFIPKDSWINAWALCPNCCEEFTYESTYLACSKLENKEPLDKLRYAQHGCYRD